jgi:large subunit ribosomal protein L4
VANITFDVIGSGRKITIDLPEPKVSVLHEVVLWQLAKRRQGSASTKTRSEVRGSTRKIYQQKGTGRARHGAITAPIFVGGGITFGPKPRDYGYSLPKKVRKLGLNMAISARANEGKVTVVDSFTSSGKTKEFVSWAKGQGLDGKERVLLVTDNELTRQAARNLPWVDVLPSKGINVYDILRHERLIVEATFFDQLAQAKGSDVEDGQ